MKVYNPKSNFILTTEILNLIHVYRKAKNFNPNQYIKIKAELLNKYMTKFGLKSCVIAVSGGIDSALVLSLVYYASQLKNSPITGMFRRKIAADKTRMKNRSSNGWKFRRRVFQ